MNVEKVRCATEQDMGWFCTKCETLVHWKVRAYHIIGSKQYLCEKCYRELERKEKKNA